MIIVNSNVLHVIFQTCWACVFIVPAPGVKDRSAWRACVRRRLLCFFGREGKTVLRQVNFIIPSFFFFFTKSKIMFLCFFVEVYYNMRHRRASFFWYCFAFGVRPPLVFSAVVVARKCLFCLLCGDVLKSRLVSYCIASLVSVGRLLGHLLWLTGNCVQLNWSSILLDGYKKSRLSRQPSREDLLVRRPKSAKTIDSTVRLHRAGTPAKDISIAFYLTFLLLVSLLFLVLRSYFSNVTSTYYMEIK